MVGLLVSGSGLIILLGVLHQATSAHAAAVPRLLPPKAVDIAINLPLFSESIGAEMTSARLSVEANKATLREGIPWDTCAGAFLIPSKDCFISWKSNPTLYRVTGSVGSATSQGEGVARIGFKIENRKNIFFDVEAIFVPDMREPLAGAVYMSLSFGLRGDICGAHPRVGAR